MAMEYKLPITASELKEKILSIDKKVELIDGKIPTEYLPENIGVQADHAQNDDTQPDYIKNRIAYSNGVKDISILNKTITFAYDGDMGMYMSTIEDLSDADIAFWNGLGDITVMWDNTAYPVSKIWFDGVNFWGNAMMAGLDSTGEPFVVGIDNYSKAIMLMSLTDPAPDDPDNAPTIDHTIKISYQKDNVYADSKYFNIDNILTVKNGDIIHKKTKYIFEFDEDMGMGYCYLDGIPFVLPEGKKIKVYWDNVEYLCTVTQIGEDGDDILAVGSIDALMNEDLSLINEPFIIVVSNTSQYTDIYSLNTGLIHELQILAEDEYQTTIDNKYLNIQFEYDDYAMSGSENLLTSGTIYQMLGNRSYLTIDSSVNEYSGNPVSSQAVYYALQNVDVEVDDTINNYSDNAVSSKAVYNALKDKLNKTDVVHYTDSSSDKPISSRAVYNAFGNSFGHLIVDNEVNNNSAYPVSSQAVYNALGGKNYLIVETSISDSSNNPISSKAVYETILTKQDKIPISEEDNGKFMRVVNGAWAAVALPNAEEALF